MSNMVISVEDVQGGYFRTAEGLLATDFTYYQLQTGQIRFVHQGDSLPNITLRVGSGSGKAVRISPLVQFFKTNDGAQSENSLPLGAIIGAVGGAIALGLTAAGVFKLHQHQKHVENKRQLKLAAW